jgi:hypothetical protein
MTVHLARTEAAESIQDVVRIARQQKSCLMCCCPDWEWCHRKSVVEAITDQTEFAIAHLERTGQATRRKAA